MKPNNGTEIAIIGMSGRFPGSDNIEQFWNNLKEGVESISFFSKEELISAGEDEFNLDNPLFVRASSYLKGKEYFDSTFFSYRPDEARFLDPQTRIFLECIWHAIEDAGYGAVNHEEKIGLFAGGSSNVNWMNYVHITGLNNEVTVDPYTATILSNE